jgi:hypothetical protein
MWHREIHLVQHKFHNFMYIITIEEDEDEENLTRGPS